MDQIIWVSEDESGHICGLLKVTGVNPPDPSLITKGLRAAAFIRLAKEGSKPSAAPLPLRWTKEKPKVKGWCWVKVVCETGDNPLGLRFVIPGEWDFAMEGAHYEFAGPLIEPEPTPSPGERGEG